MAGLKQHFPEFLQAGNQVDPSDIDSYTRVSVGNPSTSATWFGTATGTNTTASITLLQALPDHPRNLYYTVSGISSGTYGGVFTANITDQFGQVITETITIATAVNGGTTFGTAIVARVNSLAFATTASSGTFIGTANVGFGTLSNGSAQSNWFGLLDKIGGTGDIKSMIWINNGTTTGIAKGTNLGTSIQVNPPSFQGTSGVAITDSYRVVLKSTADNSGTGSVHIL
jgi:hypothetical protein